MPRRIAVIGAGPKGLYCLESLAAELHRVGGRSPLEVHVFEPHPVPGAGPVYDPSQPDFLRMNFANGKIDMWPRHRAITGPHQVSGPSFVDYLSAKGLASSDTGYAPRRLVGAYLHEGFERVIKSLQLVAEVCIHTESVLSIERRGRGFDVCTQSQSLLCDEVVVATGHSSRGSETSKGLSPYPIDQPGGVGDIAPGSAVAVRGLGLTAIDVALALTEGRGGRFVSTALPGQLVYQRSGLEAGLILLFSRTGRPMVPKPHPVLMRETEEVADALSAGSAVLDGLRKSSTEAVVDALIKTSASVLYEATGEASCDAVIRHHLQALLDRKPIDRDQSISEMRMAVETAFGRQRPGPDWALGVTWRGIYPALVRLVARRQLDDGWDSFSELAVEMERVAFGPPAENAARMLALIDAGIVHPSCSSDVPRADVLVNAVIDPPGAAPRPSPLMASLLDSGLARTTAHSPGLDVCADGTCIGVDGELTEGLAAVGRPTEGSILGNDTLSRRLHNTPELWARATVRRLGLSIESRAA